MIDENIGNYADDSTPYALGNDIEIVTQKLQNDSLKLFLLCSQNAMKANPDKSHQLLRCKDLNLSAIID